MTTNGGVFMPLILRRFVYGFAWSGLLLLALAARADDKATIVKNSGQALADLRGYASGSAALLDKAAGSFLTIVHLIPSTHVFRRSSRPRIPIRRQRRGRG